VSPPGGKSGPEAVAREHIDAALEQAGWAVQDRDDVNLTAARGVAVREFKLADGFADYLLFLDGAPVGVLEAKPEGYPLAGVEGQAKKYTSGLPAGLHPPVRPLPFMYLSTGTVTKFANLLDPEPRSRPLFRFHQPETLAEWLAAETLDHWVKAHGGYTVADATKPSTLRARLRALPPLDKGTLYPNQVRAVANLEDSLRRDKPRALIQMATGSGKTIMAVSSIYRLIKFGGARRVLFLVDRTNLGEQAEKEFQGFRTPDDNRKFTELYNVQRLTSNTIGSSSKVVITTIQRLFSMLRGDTEFDESMEQGSGFSGGTIPAPSAREPVPVSYCRAIPPEFFDVIFIDECHRSIYSLWRQVLEYFDAHLVGLTATPANHTYGFFNQNVVMEYHHEEAVADGVNVDFEIYKIRTRITAEGSTIEAEDGATVGLRDRRTRAVRWEQADEDVTYAAEDVDRSVVAKDQIRLIVRTFRDRVWKEAFPGRAEVPKTLIFAKDDSHAEDIIEILREEFDKGNDFAQKITYKTTGASPRQLIQDFRTGYNPRIAVTVDLVATGTDIKPVEIVMFMRSIKSRVLFEQMKGRGVRVIDPTDLRAVSPSAPSKTHFVIVDCVGVTESKLADTQPLERKKAVAFGALLEHVAMGGTDPDTLSSLASRLARLDRRCSDEDRALIAQESAGATLKDISHAIVEALEPDAQRALARTSFQLPEDAEPTDQQLERATQALLKQAAEPLATRPKLRKLLEDLKRQHDQIIDEVSKDELLEDETGLSAAARDKARALVASFQTFLAENKDEIDALQFFYSVPHRSRLRFDDIKALAAAIKAPPRSWTPEALWRAYEILEKDAVKGASATRLLTDLVSLVRYALHQDSELVPHADRVRARFDAWLAAQRNTGKRFSPDQLRWLEMMRDHVATSLDIDLADLDEVPFVQEGGLGKATQVFGKEVGEVLNELNEALAA
jgi:type I restriction enzyme R subunit